MIPLHSVPSCVPDLHWGTVLKQEAPAVFSADQWSANQTGLFSVMDILESYRDCQGRFHLRLQWPGLNLYNEWWQETNPAVDDTVGGFRPFRIGYSEHFYGLKKSSNANVLMDSHTPSASFGVGAKALVGGGTKLNGPQLAGVGTKEVDAVVLSAKIDCVP